MALFGRKNEQDATLGKPPMGWGVPGVQKDESVDPVHKSWHARRAQA